MTSMLFPQKLARWAAVLALLLGLLPAAAAQAPVTVPGAPFWA